MNRPPAQSGNDAAPYRPPQFGLRGMLLGVTLAAAACGLFVWFGAVWAVAVLFFGSLAAAHVFGNWMGTTLRGQARPDDRPSAEDQQARARLPEVRGQHLPTKMQRHERLGRVTRWSAIAIGLMSAAIVSGAMGIYGEETNLVAIAMAGLAAGTIGGLFSYAAASFVGMLFSVWRDAIRDHAQQD